MCLMKELFSNFRLGFFSCLGVLDQFQGDCMNTLRHDRNTLAHITHTQLLKAVLESINAHQFFDARDPLEKFH